MNSWMVPVNDAISARDAADPNNGSLWPYKFGSNAAALSTLPAEQQAKIVGALQSTAGYLTQNGWLATGENLSRLATVIENNKRIVPVAIIAVQLSYEAIQNILAWWNATIAGGFGGAAAGAAIGSLGGPVGAVIGGIAGSIVGSFTVAELSKRLTEKIFDVPRSVALENAYSYFGLTTSSSNGEINSAYRRLALQKHPDKGGSKEEFLELQVNLAVIKKQRDDL